MVLAVHRVARHVGEHVVHPAHVPLVVEAEAAALQVGRRRAADAGEGGGFFGEGDRLGALGADEVVHAAQEVDGFEVLASAETVGHPLAGLAAVVAVEHGGHRIHAQAVDAEALDPVQRVAAEVVAYLAAAVVVDQRVPILVKALARVGVLVKVRAVEFGQAVRIAREVGGHPVEDHAQPRGVRGVGEGAEILRCAEARGGRVQPDRLVAPGAVEGVLVHRHQLEVGEAVLHRIRDQALGQLAVAEPAAVGVALPGAKVHLVDADRRIERVGALACRVAGHAGQQALHH